MMLAQRKRRSLVLTTEDARHPFRASLPPHVCALDTPDAANSRWYISRDDVRGFASTYFATLAAVLVFLI